MEERHGSRGCLVIYDQISEDNDLLHLIMHVILYHEK